jgi:hypothetical protein
MTPRYASVLPPPVGKKMSSTTSRSACFGSRGPRQVQQHEGELEEAPARPASEASASIPVSTPAPGRCTTPRHRGPRDPRRPHHPLPVRLHRALEPRPRARRPTRRPRGTAGRPPSRPSARSSRRADSGRATSPAARPHLQAHLKHVGLVVPPAPRRSSRPLTRNSATARLPGAKPGASLGCREGSAPAARRSRAPPPRRARRRARPTTVSAPHGQPAPAGRRLRSPASSPPS